MLEDCATKGLTHRNDRAYYSRMATTTERAVTTIQVTRETWRQLNALRSDPLETLDQVIRRLLDERDRAEAKG